MLPKALYELLPITYIITGIASMSIIESLISFFSGILLVASGIAIFYLRRNYRASRCDYPQSRINQLSYK